MDYKKGIRILLTITIITICMFYAVDADAQCPMCRMTAEGNLRDGGSAGKGLNNGILYMLSMPYLMVGIIGYVWWKNNRNQEEVE